MSEIKRQDIISDEALQAPKQLADSLSLIVVELDKIIGSSKELNKTIASSNTTTKLAKDTEELTLQEKELVKVQSQISTALAKNNDEYIAYKKGLDAINKTTKDRIALGDRDARTLTAQNSSLKELTAALNKNRDAYKSLSNEEARNSEEGKKLLAVIQRQDADVKKLNASTGKFQDNVGNYPSQLGKARGAFEQMAPGLAGTANGFIAMTRAALAFIATPIGIVVAALGAAIFALTSYFRGSEEGQNRLNKITKVGAAIFEQFMNVVEGLGEAIFDAISNPQQAIKDFGEFIKQNLINRFVGMLELFPKLGKAFSLLFEGEFSQAGQVALDAVAKVTLGVENATAKIVDFANETSKAIQAGIEYGNQIAAVEAKIAQEDRRLTVERAKSDLEVAKLRDQALQLRGKERRDIIEQAIKLEQKLSDREVAFANLKLRLAKLELEANGDDIEAKKKVAEAEAAVINAEKLRYDNTFKFRKQLEALDEQEKKKEEERIERADRIAESQKKKTVAFFSAIREPATALQQGLVKTTQTAAEKWKEWADKGVEALNKVMDQFSNYSSVVNGLLDELTAKRLARIDAEEARLDEQLAKDLENAGNNDRQKERLEADAEKRREQLEKKRIAAQRKAAVFDKAVAITQAGILTAINILKVFPNPILMALAAAVGAIQIATIIAKPIPQFFKGTDSAPGGLAVVGEKGAELMIGPDGKVGLTPSTATLMDVAKGTQIIPHDETMKALAMSSVGEQALIGRENIMLYGKLDSLERTIREYDSKIVDAIIENSPDLYEQGSLLYRNKKKADGSKRAIRLKSLNG